MKRLKYIFLGIFILFACASSLYIGYTLYDEPTNDKNISMAQNDDFFKTKKSELIEKEVSKIDNPKVSTDTKFVYEYFYKQDDILEKVEDKPPYFSLNLTRNELENLFEDWEVKSFSNSEVVLRKVIEGESSQNYVIGEYDGYIAVYYEKPINGTTLKDITSIDISSLPLEEQQNIKDGIKIKGEENLIQYISNYES